MKFFANKKESREALAKDTHSISTLQRFENDNAKIDIDTLWTFLDRLNIQIDEYYLEYHHYQYSNKEMYREKFRDAIVLDGKGKAFLDALQQEYANTHDIFYLFLIVQAKAVLVRLPNYTGDKVSPEEMNKVSEYLAQVEDWGYFELAMYTNCLGLFGSEFRNFNYHDVIAQFRKFKSSSKHTLAFIKFLINSILLSFEEKNYDEVVDLLANLYDATSDSDYIKGRLYWRFFSRLYQSITGNFEFDGSITIETFKLLGYIDEVENLLEIEHALLGEDKTGL